MSFRTLEELTGVIGRTSATLSKGLKDQGLTSVTTGDVDPPSFKAINPSATRELVNATRELEALVQGPGQMLSVMAFAYHDVTSLGILLEFDIPSHVPLKGSINVEKLSQKSGLGQDKLARTLRYATTNFVFQETSPGEFAHTAASSALALDPNFSQFLLLVLIELAPLAVALPFACEKWPDSEKLHETATNAMTGKSDTFFKWLSQDQRRQERFDAGMTGFSGTSGKNGDRPQTVDVKAYPWVKKLGQEASIVDVGGGSGHVSQALARAYPGFKLTVQDRPEVIITSRKQQNIPDNLNFQEHNFLTKQPLHGADVYFLRQIMHDWPDAECVGILQALIPALKPGSRILVSEYVIPPAEVLIKNQQSGRLDTKMMRQMDLQMMACFNAKERTVDDFATLFKKVDPRLEFVGTYQIPEDPKSCIFETIWMP